jgi:hypothetical protein
MQAGGRIEHHVARGQLDAVHAVAVIDLQFAAIVVGRIGQEQRGRDIGTQLASAVRMDAHAAIDMGEGHALAIAIEHGRIDQVGQRRADEARMPLQRGDDEVLALQGDLGRSSICWLYFTGAPW